MERTGRFEDFKVYSDSRALVSDVFRVTRSYPVNREHVLVNQIKRAVLSISSNIAEGFERDGNKEFRQYLAIAKGSVGELRSHFHTVYDLGFLDEKSYGEIIEKSLEISRQLSGLMRYLKNASVTGRKYIK